MKQRLELRQQQKLIITPEMQLSFEVLIAPVLELKRMIDEEMQINPFLEEMPREKQEYDWSDNDELPWWERLADRRVDIYSYIKEQINILPDVDEKIKSLMKKLVEFMDEKGFVSESIENIASILGCSIDDIEFARANIMKKVEPSGCCSLDFNEYIKFQLEELGFDPDIPLSKDIISKYNLKPYPLWGFDTSDETVFIEPDAYVVKVGNHYQVYLNERLIPRLVINEEYRTLLLDPSVEDEVKNFLNEKLKRSVALLQAIEQRNRTLRKTVEAIVEFERDFLDKGPAFLKPLTLKDVAEKVNLHISTVSRVVNSKYVHTPQGTYPLRFFFEDKGFEIKKRIKEIISLEDKKKPLSDRQIAEILNKEGFNVARRTVAKYREELGIPSSSKRKRLEG